MVALVWSETQKVSDKDSTYGMVAIMKLYISDHNSMVHHVSKASGRAIPAIFLLIFNV